jgi:hypothetical protein
MKKSKVIILNQLNIKNNKIDKDNFLKNHNKKKIMWGNTIIIHSILKKKTTKLKSQSVQYKKYIKLIKIIIKKYKKINIVAI